MQVTENKPRLEPLTKGEEFKTFSVTAEANMVMPEHISTKEATVIVQEGKAVLKIGGKEDTLSNGEVRIIPGQAVHSLSVVEDFKAIIVMAIDSNIEFK